MDLVIKLYNDKPSKIGVRYTHEYMAIREYEDLVKKYRGQTLIVSLELIKDKLNMVIQAEESGGKVVYKALDFKLEQIQRLQAYYTAGSMLEFVHVFSKGNAMFVAKAFRKPEFFKVSGFEMIGVGSVGF